MSRRVFDVGLDMGRIRHPLKHNKDGKENKRSKSYKSIHSKDDTYIPDTASPTPQDAIMPQLQHKKSSPTIHPEQNGHQRNQSSDPVLLPSPHPRDGFKSQSPLHPEQSNEDQQKSSYQSQTYRNHQQNGTDGSPGVSRTPDDRRRHSEGDLNFDLKPPPPNTKVKNIDTLSEQLFSGDHLFVILQDPSYFLRFTAFLNRYRPRSAPVLVRYLEAQKALKAVEYANTLAETIKPAQGEHSSPCPAASVDPRFEARLKRSFESLVNEALPAFITNSLTKVVTESMVREITGTGMPYMRELVGGLAEVFCLADPSIKDCPIVYASEEFYRTTRYSRDDVLGRNCRFLQGPKTSRLTVERLSKAIKSSQEICETILNYRRDGKPFMNLLLTAPLYDNRGSVRYFIGAQIDVSGLIEDGRGLDSFASLLAESKPNKNRDSDQSENGFSQKHLRVLNEFSQLLSLDESSVFQKQHSRASSLENSSSVYRGTPTRSDRPRQPRRVLGNEDEGEKRDEWALSSIGPSGRLPGVYQNVSLPTRKAIHHNTPLLILYTANSPADNIFLIQYLLIRPFPSLRIIFVSPALRIPGLLQSPFLSRIGGPTHVRDGLSDAFEAGAAVTAKITWLPNGRAAAAEENDNNISRPGSRRGGDDNGQRTRYISCTPLLGSDDQVGVWMIVMVENEVVTGSLASRTATLARYTGGEHSQPIPPTTSEYQRESTSLEDGDVGRAVGTQQQNYKSGFERSNSAYQRRGKVGSDGGALYAEFMRNGGIGKLNDFGADAEGAGGDDYLAGGNGVNGAVNGASRIEEIRSP
ncbi:hypothetical protein ACLMJK_004027 [Lecanora helva]